MTSSQTSEEGETSGGYCACEGDCGTFSGLWYQPNVITRAKKP
jgi:hypothetical protein